MEVVTAFALKYGARIVRGQASTPAPLTCVLNDKADLGAGVLSLVRYYSFSLYHSMRLNINK